MRQGCARGGKGMWMYLFGGGLAFDALNCSHQLTKLDDDEHGLTWNSMDMASTSLPSRLRTSTILLPSPLIRSGSSLPLVQT